MGMGYPMYGIKESKQFDDLYQTQIQRVERLK